LTRRLEPSRHSSPGLSLWQGFMEATPVILVISGVGKVSAALAAQFVVDVFKPSCCLSVGLAGATRSGARPGELIVASGALQHDMDARPIADSGGVIPGLGMATIPSDRGLSGRLRLAAEKVAGTSRTIRSGVVLTGDAIITSRDKRDQLVKQFPSGVCFDMETAAVAQVAYQNGIPWAALRITSDAADEDFNLEDVVGFGAGTAAEILDAVVQGTLQER